MKIGNEVIARRKLHTHIHIRMYTLRSVFCFFGWRHRLECTPSSLKTRIKRQTNDGRLPKRLSSCRVCLLSLIKFCFFEVFVVCPLDIIVSLIILRGVRSGNLQFPFREKTYIQYAFFILGGYYFLIYKRLIKRRETRFFSAAVVFPLFPLRSNIAPPL